MSLADDQAFESFVRAYGTTLIRLAGALTGNPDVSEEVVQSALERLFVRWRRVDDPLAYARQVVVNLCKDRGRGAVRRERAGLPFAEIPAPDVIGMHDDRDQLVRAVRALPYRQRAVVVLRFWVVDGTYYSTDPVTAHWFKLGSPEGFDPGTGTTPREYLATVSEDAGGATLHRIIAAMTGQTTRQLADGSTVYSGTVPAGAIAREQGFKEGQSIRVLPFGYVAHDEAADPAAPLAVRLTVGADGIIRLISVHWGSNSSAWDYTVAYSGLGHTPAPVAPKNATAPQPIDTSSPVR